MGKEAELSLMVIEEGQYKGIYNKLLSIFSNEGWYGNTYASTGEDRLTCQPQGNTINLIYGVSQKGVAI